MDLLEVKHFDEQVSHILLKYTHKLPEYFDKIEKYSQGRKPRLTKSISYAEKLRRKHQERMRRLDKAGWNVDGFIRCSALVVLTSTEVVLADEYN